MTKRRKFSKEFKQQVVDAVVREQKQKVSRLKKQHRLSDPLVYSWVRTHRQKAVHPKPRSLDIRMGALLRHVKDRLRFYETRFKELKDPSYSMSCGLDASLVESYLDSMT